MSGIDPKKLSDVFMQLSSACRNLADLLAASAVESSFPPSPIAAAISEEHFGNMQRSSSQEDTSKIPEKKKKTMTGITAFVLFCRERRPALQRQHPEMPHAELSKELGKLWKEADRAFWIEQARTKEAEDQALANTLLSHSSKPSGAATESNTSSTINSTPKAASRADTASAKKAEAKTRKRKNTEEVTAPTVAIDVAAASPARITKVSSPIPQHVPMPNGAAAEKSASADAAFSMYLKEVKKASKKNNSLTSDGDLAEMALKMWDSVTDKKKYEELARVHSEKMKAIYQDRLKKRAAAIATGRKDDGEEEREDGNGKQLHSSEHSSSLTRSASASTPAHTAYPIARGSKGDAVSFEASPSVVPSAKKAKKGKSDNGKAVNPPSANSSNNSNNNSNSPFTLFALPTASPTIVPIGDKGPAVTPTMGGRTAAVALNNGPSKGPNFDFPSSIQLSSDATYNEGSKSAKKRQKAKSKGSVEQGATNEASASEPSPSTFPFILVSPLRGERATRQQNQQASAHHHQLLDDVAAAPAQGPKSPKKKKKHSLSSTKGTD